MDCAQTDYFFVTLLGLFVLGALVATWYTSSLVKLLELRHPAAFASLGRPSVTKESTSQDTALLWFLWSGKYKKLADAKVNACALVLRLLAIAGTINLLGMVAIIFTSSSPEATATLQCFFGHV